MTSHAQYFYYSFSVNKYRVRPSIRGTNIIGIDEIDAVMHMNTEIEQIKSLARSLEGDLMDQYGPLLTGEALIRSLGYPSLAALRQAVARGKAPVPILQLKDRRGKFALAKDVAYWLAEQRILACK